MMKDLKEWSLEDLIDRVTREGLVDECIQNEEYVVIVQGSTRFVLDPARAHAFLRGVVKGMSPAYRWRSWIRDAAGPGVDEADPVVERGESSGLFDSFRRHLIKKWWARYAEAGAPCGRSVRGLMLWIRYNTGTTAN